MEKRYLLPPLMRDHENHWRRAGFELEFGNLPVIETAEALQGALGGTLDLKSPFEAVLEDSCLGKLKIERDAALLKSVRYRGWLESLGVEFSPGTVAHEIESNIDYASRGLIPCEVVTAPIPFAELEKLEILVQTLEGLGAEGTQESLVNAFGMHINPSIPDDSVETLIRYTQAFLLLHAWFVVEADIDLTRRFLTKYIDPYPPAYMELVLDVAYEPDETQFISDYLGHNPTRNRALDLLPILCDLNEALVLSEIDPDERHLVKPRPAFHYRLPDCKFNVPGWSPAEAWNRWVYIEKLAANQRLLEELIEAWQESSQQFSLLASSSWVGRLTSILSQKYLSS